MKSRQGFPLWPISCPIPHDTRLASQKCPTHFAFKVELRFSESACRRTFKCIDEWKVSSPRSITDVKKPQTNNNHIKTISKSADYPLKNISRVRWLMSQQDLEKLVHASILSRLDYCNGAFTGLCKKSTRRWQSIQNAAARVLTKTRKVDPITPVLRSLRWLSVHEILYFKILLLVYKALNGLGSK